MIRRSMVATAASTPHTQPQARVMIAHVPSQAKCGINSQGCLLQLKHPKTGSKSCYMLIDETLQEIHWFKEQFSSWFIGDYALEDGSLYMSTPIDPIFLLLPILDEARMKKPDDLGKFRALEEILYVDGYPGYLSLSQLPPTFLDVVCEVKEAGSSKYYRLDDTKVLSWLCCKVKLTMHGLDALEGYSSMLEGAKEAHAIGLIGDYLKESPWLEMLCKHFGVDLQTLKKSMPVDANDSFDPKPNIMRKDGNVVAAKTKTAKKGNTVGLRKVTQFFARER